MQAGLRATRHVTLRVRQPGEAVPTVPSAGFSVPSETCHTLGSESRDTQSCVPQHQESQETLGGWQFVAPGFELYPVSEATQDTQALGAFSRHSGSRVSGFRRLTVPPTDGPFSRAGFQLCTWTVCEHRQAGVPPAATAQDHTRHQTWSPRVASPKPARFRARHGPTPVSMRRTLQALSAHCHLHTPSGRRRDGAEGRPVESKASQRRPQASLQRILCSRGD